MNLLTLKERFKEDRALFLEQCYAKEAEVIKDRFGSYLDVDGFKVYLPEELSTYMNYCKYIKSSIITRG